MIVAVPPDTPLTTPVAEFILAIAALLVAHDPPPVASARVVVVPEHIAVVPVIADGRGFTNTLTVSVPLQPKVVKPLTVYKVVVAGLATVLVHAVQESVAPGDHV